MVNVAMDLTMLMVLHAGPTLRVSQGEQPPLTLDLPLSSTAATGWLFAGYAGIPTRRYELLAIFPFWREGSK
jgi:hypothetical protein